MEEPIALQCTFSKATTLVDGGWRISFDSSEFSGDIVAKIASLKENNIYLVVMTEDQYQSNQ